MRDFPLTKVVSLFVPRRMTMLPEAKHAAPLTRMEPKENITLAVLAWDVQHLARFTSELKADMDRRFETVDKRFDAVDKRFDAIDRRFEALDKRFLWLLGAMGATTALLLATMGAGFLFLINRQNPVTERLNTSIETSRSREQGATCEQSCERARAIGIERCLIAPLPSSRAPEAWAPRSSPPALRILPWGPSTVIRLRWKTRWHLSAASPVS